MATYIYTVNTVKYGTPTGTNTMPASGSMTALPNTVKGSVTLEETEGATTKFYVDQQFSPVNEVKTEEGELSSTMQFYDLDFTALAVLKGGVGNASGYTPATGYTQVKKALEITTVSGHKFEMFNASLITRITGGLARDKMLAVEVKAIPLMTTDSAGTWDVKPA
jgi:hypothetical protein